MLLVLLNAEGAGQSFLYLSQPFARSRKQDRNSIIYHTGHSTQPHPSPLFFGVYKLDL